MNKFALAIAAAAAVVALPASATTVVDQSQTVGRNALAYLGVGPIISQSFTAGYDNMVGAGVFLSAFNFGTTAVTLKLLSANPASGGQVLASGTANGTAGNWVDVAWEQAALVVGQTYWLSASANRPVVFTSSGRNAYVGGGFYLGRSAVRNADLTFRTFANAPAAAVPEAGTWGMMIGGFGVMGFSLRRRSKTSTTVRFA